MDAYREVERAALALPASVRAELSGVLEDSLEQRDRRHSGEVGERTWCEELRWRVESVENGTAETTSAEAVMAGFWLCRLLTREQRADSRGA